jgi:hypothetical protein
VYVYFKSAPQLPPPPNQVITRITAASGGVTSGTGTNPISCYNNTGTCQMDLNGSPVTLIAHPDGGYTVAGWSGCTASSDLSTCTIPGTANVTVSIAFQTAPPPPPASYTLDARILAASGTVTASGINNTSINCNNNSGSCSAQESVGGTVTLTATPTQGYTVQSWSGCTPSADLSTCSVTMNASAAVDTSFVGVQSCTVPNGTGSQTWDTATNSYGPCVVTACSSGYSLSKGACVAIASACVPDKTASPRFVDNGDLTITDLWTCLMWEKKTGTFGGAADYTDPHNVNNSYTFGTSNNSAHDGTVFTDFLAKLNSGPGFAGHTDWRLPNESNANPGITNVSGTAIPGDTVNEMEGILPIDPIFGPDASDYYWTGSSGNTYSNWAWHFTWADGIVSQQNVGVFDRARAVRNPAPVASNFNCGDMVETDIGSRWSYYQQPGTSPNGSAFATTLSELGAADSYRGQHALRANTTAAFDFALIYSAATPIDASGFEQLRFAIRALNTNILVSGTPWQGSYPVVVLVDADGARQSFLPQTNLMLWDGTTWVPMTVPLAGGSGWSLSGGPIDLTRITGVEVHSDTWEWNPLVIDIDAMSFEHPQTVCPR